MLTQAETATTTIRAASTVHYLPQVAHKNGDYIPETNLADTRRDCVINDIATGQHEGVVRVFAFDISSGNAWDASEDIARQVLWQVIDAYGQAPMYCIDFLEAILGVNTIRTAEFEAAA